MRRDRGDETVSSSPDPLLCLEDYFGKEYDYEALKNNSIFNAFQDKMRAINKICSEHLLNIGEAQIMYGKFWSRVKFCELETVRQWIINNYQRRNELLK